MWEYLPFVIFVGSYYFTGVVIRFTIGTKHNIANLNPLRNCPKHTAGESSRDLGPIWVLLKKEWYKFFVEIPPIIWQMMGKIFIFDKSRSNIIAFVSLVSVYAFST